MVSRSRKKVCCGNDAPMTDTVTPERRSQITAAIRARDTQPELRVRRFLHAEGLRFRLHRTDLPGRPDLVFPSRRVCLLVHGCFWHRCPHCRHGARAVKSNSEYWDAKIARNKSRDMDNQAHLTALGWTVITIWECQTADCAELSRLAERVRACCPRARRYRPARAK